MNIYESCPVLENEKFIIRLKLAWNGQLLGGNMFGYR